MAVIRESNTELRTLRALSTGRVVSPDDAGYDGRASPGTGRRPASGAVVVPSARATSRSRSPMPARPGCA